jgi:hypothetical protein
MQEILAASNGGAHPLHRWEHGPGRASASMGAWRRTVLSTSGSNEQIFGAIQQIPHAGSSDQQGGADSAALSPPRRLRTRCGSVLPPLSMRDRRAIMIAAMLTLMAVTAVLAAEIGWLMSDPVWK